LVSTSLDGPAVIHNANRPRPGSDSHEAAVRGIRRVREALGHDRVAAIMTTTRLSLQHPEAIVDEYVSHGFDSILFRPISPYGFAVRTQQKTGYDFESFFDFYTKGLAHIIELNRRGTYFVASYAQLLLTKILTPFVVGRELGHRGRPGRGRQPDHTLVVGVLRSAMDPRGSWRNGQRHTRRAALAELLRP